ncbi:hypothetical protein AOLI_G00047850 [Acnodon oligacanthus]
MPSRTEPWPGLHTITPPHGACSNHHKCWVEIRHRVVCHGVCVDAGDSNGGASSVTCRGGLLSNLKQNKANGTQLATVMELK